MQTLARRMVPVSSQPQGPALEVLEALASSIARMKSSKTMDVLDNAGRLLLHVNVACKVRGDGKVMKPGAQKGASLPTSQVPDHWVP